MKVLDTSGSVLRINAPEWFNLPAFRSYLEQRTQPEQQQRLATFHRHGDSPNEWSDVFIPFDATLVGINDDGDEIWAAEGSDIFGTDELNEIWQEITFAAQKYRIKHGIVWISNLAFAS